MAALVFGKLRYVTLQTTIVREQATRRAIGVLRLCVCASGAVPRDMYGVPVCALLPWGALLPAFGLN